MFQIGDLILYGGTGVCQVTKITRPNIPGVDKTKLYYVLSPLYQDGSIYTPVDNPKVFMRPILSKQEANALIDKIPSLQIESFHSPVLSELSQHYNKALSSHQCSDLVELTMSIYAKRQTAQEQKKKFGTVDEKYMKRAEELLFGELAAALGIQKEDVPSYISTRVAAHTEGSDSM